MGWEGGITLLIVTLMLVGLVLEKPTPDVLVLGAVVLLILTGILTPEEALSVSGRIHTPLSHT